MYLKNKIFNNYQKGEITVTIGFVLLHVSPTHENEICALLTKIPEVIEIRPISGEYDMIAKLQAKDYESIAKITTQKIKTITGIIDIKTITGKNLR